MLAQSRFKRSHLIALALLVFICVWVGGGMLFKKMTSSKSKSHENGGSATTETASTQTAMPNTTTTTKGNPNGETLASVEAVDSTAELVTQNIVIQGQVVPNRTVVLRAKTSGTVNKIFRSQGTAVASGQTVLSLGLDDRQVRLDQAQTKLADAKRIFDSVNRLYQQDYMSKSKLESSRVDVKMAESALAQINLEISHTTVKAPFAGILDEQKVEEGDYVNLGQALMTVVDNSPLVVEAQVAQQNRKSIRVGSVVNVVLAEGEEMTGKIRFVAPTADSKTRAFRTEIEMPNPQQLPSGTSATATIQGKQTLAHFVTPALMALNANNDMGIKVVDAENRVHFYAVTPIQSTDKGVWVTGLPEQCRIITVGQAFVKQGDLVNVNLINASTVSNTSTTSTPTGQ